jgi:SagB-type dehydrogenase family enzyme
MTNGVGAREFHEQTKHDPETLGGAGLDFENKPRDHKVYVDLPRVDFDGRATPPAIPALGALTEGDPDPDAATTRSEIAATTLRTLCYYGAGVTDTVQHRGTVTRFRAASCTGALYHVDLYPVVGEDGPLPAGVYHFDPVTVSLDVLREGDYRGVLADASRDPRVAGAPVTLVAASEWWRNAWKYTERTYRHAFWDSGTILANLVTTAHALDVPARVTTGFADEQVAELLGLDTSDEAPIELVPLGAGSTASDAPAVDPIDPAAEPLSADPKEHPLIHEAYVASSLPDGRSAGEWRATDTAGGVGCRAPGDGERVPLDPVGPGGGSNAPLHAVVKRRRSHREFSDEPLNARKFATVLDRAVRVQPLDILPGDRPLALNDCYLIVNAVEGVEPGAFQYHPEASELERLHGGESEGDLRRAAAHLALGQQWGGDAAVSVYFLTDLDAVVDRLGDRGYRVAQLEAAMQMGRLYLATYAHRDLAGTGLTFFDDEVTEFFSPRAAGQTPTCLYVFGRPA